MAQLRLDHRKFVDADTEIVVVGPENARSFRKYWEKEDLPFVGLPDPKHTLLKLYGQEVKLLKLGRLPAQMLIDKSGMLRFVHHGRSMSDIPSNSDVLELVEAMESN
jgi:peroxiredoxin